MMTKRTALAVTSIFLILISLPLIAAGNQTLSYNDGSPDGAVRLGGIVPSGYATLFTMNSAGKAEMVRVLYISTGVSNDLTVQFYDAVQGPNGYLVPGTPISDAYPMPTITAPAPGAWAEVPVDVMLPAGQFFLVVYNPRPSTVPPEVYFYYDYLPNTSYKTLFLYRWYPDNWITSCDVWYFQVDVVTNNVSPFAVLKPIVATNMDKVNVMWDCLLSHLPDEPSEELDYLFSSVQEHMNNAVSISNPVFVMGHLAKALEIMKQIEIELDTTCLSD